MIKQKLITRKEESFQTVTYGLTEEIYSLIHVSQRNIAEWLGVFEKNENLPAKLRPIRLDMKEYYNKMTEKQLDQETGSDLKNALALNLFELKTMIDYDLKIDKHESDADFWKFIGNPLCRMYERSVAEKCRKSDKYRKQLFKQMDTLIDQLRHNKFPSTQ